MKTESRKSTENMKKIVSFSEDWQKNCRIIIYTFLLYTFSWVPFFRQWSFANHLYDCYRLSVDSYTISTFSFVFFVVVSNAPNVHSFRSFDKDGIDTEEHLSMIFFFHNGFTTHCLLYVGSILPLFKPLLLLFLRLCIVWINSIFQTSSIFQSPTSPNAEKKCPTKKFKNFIKMKFQNHFCIIMVETFLHIKFIVLEFTNTKNKTKQKLVWHISNVTTVQNVDFHFTLTYGFNDRYLFFFVLILIRN